MRTFAGMFTLSLGLIAWGCGSTTSKGRGPFPFDDDGGGEADLAVTFADDGGVWNGPCDDVDHPCRQGERCYMSMCIQDNGGCTDDNQCENDTYCDCTGGGGGDAGPCMGGVCVPWGSGPKGTFDPDCTTPGFSASQFVAPKIKCQWGQGNQSSGTLVTPIVADLDGDKKPEITFQSYPSGFTSLHADCSVYFTKTFNFAERNQSQLAVADLDGDKIPEIVGVDA